MMHSMFDNRGTITGGAAHDACGSPAPRSSARSGFTLIELLVVVSIISVLIAILMPALGSARAQGLTTKCLSNMREMGMSLQMYALTNEEYIPAADCDTTGAEKGNYWLCILQRYTEQPLIAQCPKDKTTKPFLDWANLPVELDSQEAKEDYRWSSYAINFCLVGASQNVQNPDGEYSYLKRIRRPDSVIYLAAVRCGSGYDSADHIHADRWEVTLDAPKTEVAWDRHRGKSNYLFADGHVETLHWKQTWNWPRCNFWWPSHAPAWPPPEEPPP